MKTILVVDDERDLLTAVAGVLEDEGYEIIECGNGRDALECLRKRRPDLALIDVMMPFMSGTELVDHIHREPKLSGLPIVLMSAVENTEAKKLASAFLKKPFALAKLVSLVHDLLAE